MVEENNERAAFRALALSRREGISFDEAAQRLDRDPHDLARWVDSALESMTGVLYPADEDDLPRWMLVITDDGVEDAEVVGSVRAQVVHRHWQAAWHQRDGGDSSHLPDTPIEIAPGVWLTADPDVIDDLAWQKDLDVYDIYTSN